MANMQIAVGLGRKAGLYPAPELICFQIAHDDVANEVRRSWLVGAGGGLGIGRTHT
jgi:hypothetical protein